MRVELERLPALLDRLTVAAHELQHPAQVMEGIRGQRVQRLRPPQDGQRRVKPGRGTEQHVAVVVVRGGSVRVQRDGPLVLALGGGEVPVVLMQDEPERGVRVRQRGIERNGAPGRALGLRVRLARR